MNKIYIWIFWIALAGGVAWYFLHQHQKQVKEQRATEIQHREADTRIVALALKYNAVTNWESSLPVRGGGEQPFSIDVSRAMLGSNQQPVLVKCNVRDVFEKDGKIIASLSSMDTANSLSLELQCNPVQSKIFTNTNQFADFGVVFKCQEVHRLSGGDDGFAVKGELLDVVQMP